MAAVGADCSEMVMFIRFTSFSLAIADDSSGGTCSTVGRDSSGTRRSSKVRWKCSGTALRSNELSRLSQGDQPMPPAKTETATMETTLAAIVAHPTRARAFMILAERTASPVEIAQEI